MARGGKRVGAGRKAGSLTVKTREIAEKAAQSGVSMLEIMVANARHFHKLATDAEKVLEGLTAAELAGMAASDEPLDEKSQMEILLAHVRKSAELRMQSQSCAKDAATYLHARISPVEAKVGTASEEIVPVAERLKALQREDAIKASGSKVVALKPK